MVKSDYISTDTLHVRDSYMSHFLVILDVGRVFIITSLLNIPYHTNLSRKSTLDILFANCTTRISKPLYTNTNQ